MSKRPTTISSRLYNVRRSQGTDEPSNAAPYDFDKSYKKSTQVKKRNITQFIQNTMENPKTAMRLIDEMKRAGVDEESELMQKQKWAKGRKISTLVSISDMAKLKNNLSNRNNPTKIGFTNNDYTSTFNDGTTIASTNFTKTQPCGFGMNSLTSNKEYYMKYIHHQNRNRIQKQIDAKKNFIPQGETVQTTYKQRYEKYLK